MFLRKSGRRLRLISAKSGWPFCVLKLRLRVFGWKLLRLRLLNGRTLIVITPF